MAQSMKVQLAHHEEDRVGTGHISDTGRREMNGCAFRSGSRNGAIHISGRFCHLS